MSILDIFGPLNFVGDARAMSEDDIKNMQMAQAHLMVQAQQQSAANAWRYMNYLGRSAPEKPLDERFADFKLRLAAARKRRGMDETASAK